jgi:starvation-inducible DNA-binding protein
MATDSPVVRSLSQLLADALVMYHKLHHYHWSVTGRDFYLLHEKFEQLYEQWADVIDEVAERIVMIDGQAHPTLAEAIKLSNIKEDPTTPDGPTMVQNVVADLKTHQRVIAAVIEAAEAAGDQTSANLVDGLNDSIEKSVWMLSAWLNR